MAMGRVDKQRQDTLWVETTALPSAPGHPPDDSRHTPVRQVHSRIDSAEEP